MILNKYSTVKINMNFTHKIYKLGHYHYNWHREIELLWLLSGRVEANVQGKIYNLREDDILVVNSNVGHANLALDPNSIALVYRIDPNNYISQGLDVRDGSFNLNPEENLRNPARDEIIKILSKLSLGFFDGNLSNFEMNLLNYELMNNLYEFYTIGEPKDSIGNVNEDNILKNAVEYLDRNFREDISLEKLAGECNYSTTHMSKTFKQELGINFYEYLTRLRLQEAIHRLSSDDKISDIAIESGFTDIRSFNKTFKTHFGMTPSDYRKQLDTTNRDIDRFHDHLSEREYRIILEKFEKIVEEGIGQTENPCEGCVEKEYRKKYEELVKSIENLLPRI